MAHVFISYVRENSDVVDKLADALTAGGLKVWLDRKDLAGGARWKDKVRKAIENGDYFLACFSREYSERLASYMNEELTLAIDMLRKMQDREWFIPVLLSGGIPERRISNVEQLSDLNAIDLSGDWADGIQKLLKSLGYEDPKLGRALHLANVASHFDAPESPQAIKDLGELGVADKRVVAVLLEAIKAPAVYTRARREAEFAATRSLQKIGSPIVPFLAAALATTTDERFQYHILNILRRLGTSSSPAVPAIVTVLRGAPIVDTADERFVNTVAARAMWTLGAIGEAAADAVVTLSNFLTNPLDEVRTTAASALAEIGLASVPHLVEALKVPDIRGDIAAAMLSALTVQLSMRDKVPARAQKAQAARLVRRRIFAAVGPQVAVPAILDALGANKEPGHITKVAAEVLKNFGYAPNGRPDPQRRETSKRSARTALKKDRQIP